MHEFKKGNTNAPVSKDVGFAKESALESGSSGTMDYKEKQNKHAGEDSRKVKSGAYKDGKRY
jgi:hypothetical protein